MRKSWLAAATLSASLVSGIAAANELTLYSGRGESFVQPIVNQFERDTGIKVNVRYGDTAQLALLLQEEGTRTRADLYWGQDAGAMGSLAKDGLLATLPSRVYDDLPAIYTSRTGQWVAASGRARVLTYSTERVNAADLPSSVFELTDPKYKGRLAVPPTNGGFQAFVTAMRVQHGDERTLEWLKGIRANEPVIFRNNTTSVQGIADGDVDFAIVNSYYLPRFVNADPNYPVAQTFFAAGDIGNLVNVAGIGVLAPSRNKDNAVRFIEYLLSQSAQQYFTSVINEYPVTPGVISNPVLTDLSELLVLAPEIDLDELADLPGTLRLLRDAGLM
ncbi:iron ABC transporter substrate-binding protein [Salinispirillum sp. LH 10-3-1]|uniref:Iron ABC transporter substrate-binding protein n=1 Tax=Salinispirillum sp. LH 10-3-1 TaxID=2952525 RepID=A0AB38YIQ2_9GAMM